MVQSYPSTAASGHHQLRRPKGSSVVAAILSAALIVGLPFTFWIALLEFVNYVLSLDITVQTRMTIAMTLAGLLALIWASIMLAVWQQKNERG